MPRLLAAILARLRPPGRRAGGDDAARPRDPEDRLATRALAEVIDRAMDLGLWEHADRVARTASRLAPGSALLSDRIARLRLALGDPEAALGTINACGKMTASLRLLRAACLVGLGSRQLAHSDLLRWSRRSATPLDARLMLALLEWEAGDTHAATQALLRNLKHLEDPRTLELLLLLAVAQGRTEQAAAWAARLGACTRFGRGSSFATIMRCSLGLPVPSPDAAAPTAEQVEQLALELTAAEQVIPALVAAQHRRREPAVADLLERAITRARSDLTDEVRALAALARLALLRGDHAAARARVREGLAISPLSASLMVLDRELDPARAGCAEADGNDVIARIEPGDASRPGVRSIPRRAA